MRTWRQAEGWLKLHFGAPTARQSWIYVGVTLLVLALGAMAVATMSRERC